ncbi:DUF502 domain-containing protein [Methylocaldum gracile]|uniref:DUF502 domain-containing protein n=1 Tax=unclassified Methylocaldum TaxID=2622260 RepID=UPI001414FD19
MQRNILAGLVVLTPILLTWLVFDFILAKLIAFGRPWIPALYRAIYAFSPKLADLMLNGWIDSVLALLITLVLLFMLGWLTSRVVGRQILIGFELLLEKIPVLKAIYGSTKRLLLAFQAQPEQIQRVVLINYPTEKMRAVAFVTRIVRDTETGEELAVVYMPTAPNPTSGYMEIVPLSQVTPTDWTVEEGMQFVISCGTSTREHVGYSDAHRRGQDGSEIPMKEPTSRSG